MGAIAVPEKHGGLLARGASYGMGIMFASGMKGARVARVACGDSYQGRGSDCWDWSSYSIDTLAILQHPLVSINPNSQFSSISGS